MLQNRICWKKGRTNVEEIEKLLDEGADVDEAGASGITALHLASIICSSNIVQILISHGASVDKRTNRQARDTLMTLLSESVTLDNRSPIEKTEETYRSIIPYVKHSTICDARIACLYDDSDLTPLQFAVERGHEEIVNILLNNNADANLRTKLGILPLHIAVSRKNVAIVRDLLSHGASIDSLCDPKEHPGAGYNIWGTPLHCAVRNCYHELVELLINCGADVKEFTPLHMAVTAGHSGIAKMLLEHGANIHSKDDERRTPLSIAMKNGCGIYEGLGSEDRVYYKECQTEYEKMIELLMQHGAVFVPEEAIFQEGLHAATKLGSTVTLECIMKACPDVVVTCRNSRDNDCTLLHTAAECWNVKSVDFLLHHGADVNAKDQHGRTPIFYVVKGDYKSLSPETINPADALKVAELLLTNGADVNMGDKTMFEWYPSWFSHVKYYNQCVPSCHIRNHFKEDRIKLPPEYFSFALLPRRGGSFTEDDPPFCGYDRSSLRYSTILDHAAKNGLEGLVKLLLIKSADANSANDPTPLYAAIARGHDHIVKQLLDHGFDIDVNDEGLRVSLFLAVGCGYYRTIKHILESRPDVKSVINDKGRTLLHQAIVVGQPQLAKLLFKHGSDLNSVDEYGKTPLLDALQGAVHCNVDSKCLCDCFPRLVEFLLKNGAYADYTADNFHTTVRHAIVARCCTLITIVLKFCPDVGALLHGNGSPLFHAAIENNVADVAKIFLRWGANVNATNNWGQTALHLVDCSTTSVIVEMLVAYGADPNRRDRQGNTVLDIAASTGSKEVIVGLLKQGFDINIPTNNDDLRTLFTQPLIEMKAANLFVSQHNLQLIDWSSTRVDRYYHACKAECEWMKKEIVADSFSVFDILTRLRYGRNESIVMGFHLCSSHYRDEFPIYWQWIKDNFERAQERAKLLHRISTFPNNFLGYELSADLPMTFFDYLSNFDLEKLIEANTKCAEHNH